MLRTPLCCVFLQVKGLSRGGGGGGYAILQREGSSACARVRMRVHVGTLLSAYPCVPSLFSRKETQGQRA